MVALQPRHRPISRGVASVLAALLSRVSLPNGIDVMQLSHDDEINRAWKADPMNHGRTTMRWYLSALDAMAEAQAETSKVTLPVLTLAAEFDSVVDPHGVAQFAKRLASADREFITCEGAFHEVLNELDREQTYKRVGDWLTMRFAGLSKAQSAIA
jgi:lysophospholipase